MKEVPGHKKREAVEEQRKGVDMNSQDGGYLGCRAGAIGRGGARNETAKQSQVVRWPMAQRAWLGRETLPADRHPMLHCSRTTGLSKLSGPVLSPRKSCLAVPTPAPCCAHACPTLAIGLAHSSTSTHSRWQTPSITLHDVVLARLLSAISDLCHHALPMPSPCPPPDVQLRSSPSAAQCLSLSPSSSASSAQMKPSANELASGRQQDPDLRLLSAHRSHLREPAPYYPRRRSYRTHPLPGFPNAVSGVAGP